MSSDITFTKENLDTYLKELAKVFRKLNGTAVPAEIILIGGASVLANYGFREMTTDMDAIIHASSAMKQAINTVGDKFNLPVGWLNTDFIRTKSYSDKLIQVSVYYRTFSNILTIRTVAAEYLIAMKLVSGRRYKNDLSDIAGILWEHQKSSKPISYEMVDKAVTELYGDWSEVSDRLKSVLNKVFGSGDYEGLYQETRESEKTAKKALVEFNNQHPDELKKSENVNAFLDMVQKKKIGICQF